MTHAERKARWHAITLMREREQLSLDDQLARLRHAPPSSSVWDRPLPWDERPDTDD